MQIIFLIDFYLGSLFAFTNHGIMLFIVWGNNKDVYVNKKAS